MGKLPYDVFGADDSHKKDIQKGSKPFLVRSLHLKNPFNQAFGLAEISL